MPQTALVALVTAAILSTNITLGLTDTETVPALWLLVGMVLVALRSRIVHTECLLIVGIMFCYAFAGVVAGYAGDGFKLVSAALVLFAAFQLGASRMLIAACRAGVYVLFTLRIFSLAAPAAFAALYESLGLRGAEYYGGTAAVLFAEPSYLATGTFAMWAIGRLREPQPNRGSLCMLDLAAVTVLGLSFSVWALIDIVVGLGLIMRRRPLRIFAYVSAGIAAIAVSFTTDVVAGRLGVFVEAAKVLVQSGRLIEFAALDPSATHRLVQAYLAVSSAIAAPFGQLTFELTSFLESDPTHWRRPIFAGAAVALQLMRGKVLYSNTVPFQLLVYGGVPLFVLFMIPVVKAVARLWRLRATSDAAMLVLVNIVFGCIGQSILSSPFLYLCVVVGLFWRAPAASTVAAVVTNGKDFDHNDQLQQASRP